MVCKNCSKEIEKGKEKKGPIGINIYCPECDENGWSGLIENLLIDEVIEEETKKAIRSKMN